MAKLSIIIPCYYNQENIPVTSKVLFENEKRFPSEVEFEYIFVDDGSGDQTWNALVALYESTPNKVKICKLVANVGSYTAIVAGLEYATGDFNVILSADLQDPVELMVEMYTYWKQGFKLVIGNRQNREDSFGQKIFASSFHFMMKKFALENVPDGGFDYVLFDREIREKIVTMQERNTNIFYLMIWMGYAYVNIPYSRKKRDIGKSRWTVKKKIKLFVDSFISFSYFPIRMISVTGLILGLVAFFYALFVIYAKITGIIDTEGWTALMVVILFVSSFQMIALGVLGEYLWRLLDATRKRPSFIVEKQCV